MDRVDVAGLSIAEPLQRFLETEVFPGAAVTSERFWSGYADLLRDLGPRLGALLATRDELQTQIDHYHKSRRGQPIDPVHYLGFLREIGYLAADAPTRNVATSGVDAEIARMAGPQLVVPMSNARYALNAANARWGSLYDALYGTDAIADEGEAARGGKGYNKARGAAVIAKAKSFLDGAVPLAGASYTDLAGLAVVDGAVRAVLAEGGTAALATPGRSRRLHRPGREPEDGPAAPQRPRDRTRLRSREPGRPGRCGRPRRRRARVRRFDHHGHGG